MTGLSADFPFRVLVILASVRVIYFRWSDAQALLRQPWTAAILNGAAWFWFAVTNVLWQVAYWSGTTTEWRVLLLVGMLVALGLGEVARERGARG